MSFIHMTSFSFRCAKAAAIENKIRTRHSFRYWSQLEWSSHLSNPPFIIAPRRNAKKFYDKKDKSVVPAVVPKPKKEKKNKDKKVKKWVFFPKDWWLHMSSGVAVFPSTAHVASLSLLSVPQQQIFTCLKLDPIWSKATCDWGSVSTRELAECQLRWKQQFADGKTVYICSFCWNQNAANKQNNSCQIQKVGVEYPLQPFYI